MNIDELVLPVIRVYKKAYGFWWLIKTSVRDRTLKTAYMKLYEIEMDRDVHGEDIWSLIQTLKRKIGKYIDESVI